jgi:Tfp pilus assembly protein PilF
MNRVSGKRITQSGVVLAVLTITGCQHIDTHRAVKKSRPARSSSQPAEEPAPRANLSEAQAADLQIAFARTSERQGDLTGAMAGYQEAVKRDSTRADAYLRLAVLNDRQGRFRESADWYERALKAKPGDADIYCDMGYSLYLQKRWPEAETNLRQAITISPEHARAHNNLGLLLAHRGRAADALIEFRRGGSSLCDAHKNIAFVLTTQKRWNEAREQYRLALEADPKPTDVALRRRELDTLIARLESHSQNSPRDDKLMPTSMSGAKPTAVANSQAGRIPAGETSTLPALPSPQSP